MPNNLIPRLSKIAHHGVGSKPDNLLPARVRQPPNMTTVCAQWEISSEDVFEQVGGNNFQDVGKGNDGIKRCRIMPIFNLRNVGAAVSRACSEFLLRETPLH
jgi:hypothetical protein